MRASLEQIGDLVREHVPGTLAAYVFGSFARGDARPESDVDLAVLPRAPLEALERWHAQERIAAALGTDVDLVDLLRASTVLRVQVLREGRLLFDTAPGTRALFEATALGAYARLQDERRGILEDIEKRGRVHR
jgi:predicted nucleotidyltransferase